jgi:elongation factor G
LFDCLDVDDGSTVTDFLPAERARGITIQSAAVTFHWPPQLESVNIQGLNNVLRSQVTHTINLIDTPGHADFTFEVLRSLRILDGAVCILDGVAGVEAQTEKVWIQANNYSIPRIIFVNKLDREGAAFGRTIKEIGSRLRGWPAVCQIPWWEGGNGRFTGVADAIELCALKWTDGGDGKSIKRYTLEELAEVHPDLAIEIRNARSALVEAICEFDDELLSVWLEVNDDSFAIPAEAIREALRRCISDGSGKLIPVFAGASFRNIGVQPLLDAVNDLLPDPTERPDPEISVGRLRGSLPDLLDGKLQIDDAAGRQVGKHSKQSTALISKIEACALAFKVVNDPRRGVLVYVRVYSGVIKRNAALWNTNLRVTERAQRLLQMYASDAVERSNIQTGQIGVIAGLKHARTGDTLIAYPGANPKTGPPGSLSTLQLRPIEVPPPVFFAAVEPDSLGEEKNVEESLALLLREDPSLHITVDEESRQMLLSGMGELHLEIARDRLVNDFKAKASMGNIEIGYRECVLSGSFQQSVVFDREVTGKRRKAGCEATISPAETAADLGNSVERDGNIITVSLLTASIKDSEEVVPLPAELPPSIVQEALINGAAAALARGPRRGFPLHSCHVNLTFSTITGLFGAYTTPAAVASAARLAVQAALREAHASQAIGLLEPVMNVVISCDESSLGTVIHDLSSARGGHVLSLGDDNGVVESGCELPVIDTTRIYAPPDPFGSGGDGSGMHVAPGQQRHVTARVPLKEMLGYLKHLRSLTGGRGTFVMSIDRFERLSGPREKAV